MNHVVDPGKVDDSIPGAFILISQLVNPRANRRQRPVVGWFVSLLELPEIEPEVVSDGFRERYEYLPGVTFPRDSGILGLSGFVAHESNLSTKPSTNIQLNVWCLSCNEVRLGA